MGKNESLELLCYYGYLAVTKGVILYFIVMLIPTINVFNLNEYSIYTDILSIFPLFSKEKYLPCWNSQKNKMAWCKIAVMWIDTYCDNYILPLKSFHDSLID